MKILHLVLRPRLSGAEALVANLVRLHSIEGIASAIVSFAPAEDAYLDSLSGASADLITTFFPLSAVTGIDRIRHLRMTYRDFQPDIIFAHSVIPAFYAGVSTVTIPVVSVLHDASEDDYSDRRLRLTEKLLSPFRAKVVCVSAKAGRRYLHRIGGRMPLCIPNGIDVAGFSEGGPDVTALIDTLHGESPGHEYLLVQIGRINPVKQQLHSIRALCELHRRGVRALLVIAGAAEDTEYSRDIAEFAMKHGVENSVRFLGPINQVKELLHAGNCFLMPSRHEAHSVAMIEALASGIPIVASRIDSFQFAASMPGVELVDTSDPARMATAIEQLIRPVQRVFRSLEEFDISRTAHKYYSLATELATK